MLQEKKTLLIYTSICLLIWCFFSLFFAFERLYGDSAYYLFYMVNDAKYFIAHHRPASLFIEWIPLIQIKLGSSINSIIYGFSFNEAVFQVLAVLLTCLWLKDPFLGFAMIITLFVGAKWNCFNPVSELILGTPVFFFMFGILKKYGNGLFSSLLFILGAAFIIFSHPLYSIIIPLALGMYYVNKPTKIQWISLVSISIVAIILFHYKTMDWYDKERMSQQDHLSFIDNIRETLKMDLSEWFKVLFPNFIGFLVIAGINLYLLNKARNYKMIVVLFGFLISFFLYVCIKFHTLFPGYTYESFERYLFPLVLINVLVLSFNSKQINNKLLTLIFISVLYQGVIIYNYGLTIKFRNSQWENAIKYAQQENNHKYVFRIDNFYSRLLGHNWIIGNESMLTSGCIGNKQTVQVAIIETLEICNPKHSNILNWLGNSNYMYYPTEIVPDSSLNKNYFNLSGGPFILANTDTIESIYDSAFFSNIKIQLLNKEAIQNSLANDILIKIDNRNTTPLYSGMKQSGIKIGAEWINNKGAKFKGGETPILADVKSELTQYFSLILPPKDEECKLKFYVTFKSGRKVSLN